MSLIERQTVIDAFDEIRHALWEIDIPSPTVPEYVEHHEQVQSVWKLLDKKQKELYVLPSVQPEPCDDPRADVYYLAEKIGIHQLYALVVELRGEPEPCADTVSRTAAIEAQERIMSDHPLDGYEDERLLINALKALPPAQPEIISCKDCKHHWIHRCMDSMPTEICELDQTFYDANVDFCSLAERRTDEQTDER